MQEQARTTQSQGVRAFFSFDLMGSAEFKSSAHASTASGPGNSLRPEWLDFFLELFRKIPEEVQNQLEKEFERLGDQSDVRAEARIPYFRVEIWRITGDEVLFVSHRLTNSGQLALLAKVVYDVLQDLDANYLARHPRALSFRDLGLKAVLWAAGFPIRNTQFVLSPQASPFLHVQRSSPYWEVDPAETREFVREMPFDGNLRMMEFLGPEIDLGFRLGGHCCPRRLLVSLDVAELIAREVGRIEAPLLPEFHHVGWATLKGLYGERPYPLIWLDYGTMHDGPRRSYESTQSPYLERYFQGCKIETRKLINLANDYLRDTRDTRIQMYIEPLPPLEHRERYEKRFRGEA